MDDKFKAGGAGLEVVFKAGGAGLDIKHKAGGAGRDNKFESGVAKLDAVIKACGEGQATSSRLEEQG